MSRIVPNSYQTPNLYTDRLMAYLNGDEWKTLHYALRRTFGFNRERDRISVSQFMSGNGRLDEAGRLLEYGTGLSHGTQLEAINSLMRFGILIEVAPNNRENHGRLWELQLDESRIRFDLLEERHAAARRVNQRRTAKARQAALGAVAGSGYAAMDNLPAAGGSLSDRPAGVVCGTDRGRSVGQTGGGLWDRPGVVCGTDTQKPSKKPSGNTEETHSEGVAGATKVKGSAGGAVAGSGVTEGMVAAWRELVVLCEGDEARATQVWRLQERFAAVTRLKRPDPETDAGRAKLRRDWWPNLLLVLADADGDMTAAEAAMQEAFQSMVGREEPLNVVSPKSIVNVTSGVLARQRRGDVARTASRPKGFAGIDAYLERRGGQRGN